MVSFLEALSFGARAPLRNASLPRCRGICLRGGIGRGETAQPDLGGRWHQGKLPHQCLRAMHGPGILRRSSKGRLRVAIGRSSAVGGEEDGQHRLVDQQSSFVHRSNLALEGHSRACPLAAYR